MTLLPAENGRKQGQNWTLIGYATFYVPICPRYNHVKLLLAEGVLSYTHTDNYRVEMDTD